MHKLWIVKAETLITRNKRQLIGVAKSYARVTNRHFFGGQLLLAFNRKLVENQNWRTPARTLTYSTRKLKNRGLVVFLAGKLRTSDLKSLASTVSATIRNNEPHSSFWKSISKFWGS